MSTLSHQLTGTYANIMVRGVRTLRTVYTVWGHDFVLKNPPALALFKTTVLSLPSRTFIDLNVSPISTEFCYENRLSIYTHNAAYELTNADENIGRV